MTSRLASALFGTFAALGAVVFGGCGPGSETRYYCDNTGCFSCDSYGCSSVAPPSNQACTGNASCAPGSVCTSNGCTSQCTNDSTCPRGTTCQGGFCAAPGSSPTTSKECTTKADCSGGKACVGGSCQACGGTAGPCPCTAATDCASGQACVAGACTDTKNTCTYSSECGDGKLCANGQCLTSCEAAPCASGFTCDKGVCTPVAPTGGTTCTGDAQCGGDTPNCLAGTCAKACQADGDCGAGNYCNQGACAVDTRPKPNCTTDGDCAGSATPRKCIAGFCKYTCSSDQYCRTIDTRIGYCAKDGVCRDATEANASCLASTDCTGGKSCIDNQCK